MPLYFESIYSTMTERKGRAVGRATHKKAS